MRMMTVIYSWVFLPIIKKTNIIIVVIFLAPQRHREYQHWQSLATHSPLFREISLSLFRSSSSPIIITTCNLRDQLSPQWANKKQVIWKIKSTSHSKTWPATRTTAHENALILSRLQFYKIILCFMCHSTQTTGSTWLPMNWQSCLAGDWQNGYISGIRTLHDKHDHVLRHSHHEQHKMFIGESNINRHFVPELDVWVLYKFLSTFQHAL